jgi:hypothetical protein
LQQAAQLGAFVGIWSPWIIAELNRVLTWRWIAKNGAEDRSQRECSKSAQAMMEILLPSFELVPALPPYPPAWESLTDQWDIPFGQPPKRAERNTLSRRTRAITRRETTTDAMDQLRREWDCVVRPLMTNYRCSKTVVTYAQEYCPEHKECSNP